MGGFLSKKSIKVTCLFPPLPISSRSAGWGGLVLPCNVKIKPHSKLTLRIWSQDAGFDSTISLVYFGIKLFFEYWVISSKNENEDAESKKMV